MGLHVPVRGLPGPSAGTGKGARGGGLEESFEPGADALRSVLVLVLVLWVRVGSVGPTGAQRSPPGTHSTSPVSLFAVRARMNRRSESRLR